MKVKTKVLTGFLKKVRMDAEQQISEGILKFDDDGLKIDANSSPKQVRIMAWLKKEAFKEYENLGNVGMDDLENVIKVLERFDDEVILKKEGNILMIKGSGKSVDIELVAENFLETDSGEPKLEFTENFQITSTKLKDVFKDVQMNKNSIMTFETSEKRLKISNTGKYKFVNKFECNTLKGGSKVKMGSPLIDSTVNLDGNLDISIKNDYPMKIQEKTETSVITLIVAPRVDDEE